MPADRRTVIRLDQNQLDDIKAYIHKEADRARGLTPELADLAISLEGWVETTALPGDSRTFVPGANATDDTPAEREARLRRKLARLDQDLGSLDQAGAVSVTYVRGEIAKMLR